MFWLDLLKLGSDQKKALPSQPAQTWPPLHESKSPRRGDCSLHFHHRPHPNYSSEPERHKCATQTVAKKSLERVFFCSCLFKIQSRPLKLTLHAKIRVTTLTFLILKHSHRLNAPKI